jgi:hypothetical protein
MTSFSYPLAQSYIADITEPSKLSQAYGLFQVRRAPTIRDLVVCINP